MRVLISGIGRSATTLLYQQIARCMLNKFENTRFRYEPYLWSLEQPNVKKQPFGMDQLSHYGIHVHKSTPLFLRGEHSIHNEFSDKLFGAESQDKETSGPDAFLIKTIRGAGRLESYIKRYPDLKIVACMRNPLETINSSLGMFSFMGDEFHEPDNDRLVAELLSAGKSYVRSMDSDHDRTLMEYSVLWWRSLTEETLRVAKQYPENVHLFVHERYKDDPTTELDTLYSFLPFLNREMFQIRASEHAGPSIKQNHLLACDIQTIHPHLKFYFDEVLNGVFPSEKTFEINDQILARMAGRTYSQPIAGDELGRCSPTTLRGRILSGAIAPLRYTYAKLDSENRIPLDSVIADFCQEFRLCPKLEKKFQPEPHSLAQKKTFGCVITCHNNQDTILDSIVSVLDQTRPYDKIVVVDDASTDDSMNIIRGFSSKFDTIDILELHSNVGVSAARHFGISNLDTDFITHLDGDDCFWPSKNFHESKIVLEDENAVAFSDILILESSEKKLVSTIPYAADKKLLAMKLLTRQDGVPRDMTFARKLYFQAGGYDLRLSLFEDLDFKYRLAAKCGTNWRQSNAPIGTIYNRKNPMLSRDHGLRLPRALTSHFFRYVEQTCLTGLEAADAYRDLVRHYPSHWRDLLFDRLVGASSDEILRMKTALLGRQMDLLPDQEFVKAVEKMCQSPTFNVVIAPWRLRYGVGSNEGPHSGFAVENLHWQTSKSCGFIINSRTRASGVRALLYLPHLAKQKLNVIVEQEGVVVQQSFVLKGFQKDEGGNHVLQELEIPISLRPGTTKISCYAMAHTRENEQKRNLYCLFADWQLYC